MKRFLVQTLLLGIFFSMGSNFALAQNIDEQKRELEKQLEELNREVEEKQKELSSQKAKSGNFKSEVKRLTDEINAKKGEIGKKESIIGGLGKQIGARSTKIKSLVSELGRERSSLGQILRKKRELDDYTLFEALSSQKTLSQMYADNPLFGNLSDKLSDSAVKIKQIKQNTEKEKKTLEEQKTLEANVKYSLELDKKKVEIKNNESKNLLSQSQSKEKSFEQLISDQKKKMAQIRSKLFSLAGNIPEGGIPFGQAYDYAKKASELTGVRSAIILAILKQESGGKVDSFGHNVGQCFLTDEQTGSGKNKKTGNLVEKVMKPNRDVQPFLRITKALGRDPFTTPVSCPFSYGYGGAMGISQFIPSTWVLYENRISGMFGGANPWNPQHAITATALLMKDNGAGSQNYSSEKNAACKYYSGSSCSGTTSFYGNSVMKHAENIQSQIDLLEGK
jgi:hypothetical protein